MSRHLNQIQYPQHHPHHGRPYIEVHDHDVLCGRGVNIAQHPGNERFRSLVNTRQDDSYCTTFSTSEKRALAEEIVAHISNLDPPGRFLKRSGRSHTSRGLAGPWEQLSHRECIKKTCQALRDCNRQDRQGYAALVAAPIDVAASNEERAKSGLTLKEYAAAVVAKAHPAKLNPNHFRTTSSEALKVPSSQESSASDDRNRLFVQVSNDDDARVSPSVDLAAQWLKKQRNQEPHNFISIGRDMGGAPEAVQSNITSNQIIHSTPAPLIAPVPVTNTPANVPPHNGHVNDLMNRNHAYDVLAVPDHTDSPGDLPSPVAYHPDSMAPAPYSPVVLLNDHDGVDPNSDMEPHPHLDAYTANHPHHHHHHDVQQYDDPHQPHPFHSDVQRHPIADVLQSAAAIAASNMDHHSLHHRNNSLSFEGDDDDDPLHIPGM